MTRPVGLHTSWPLGRLKHFVAFKSGGTPLVERTEYWAEDAGTPWVTIADMTRGFRVTKTDRSLSDAGLRALRSQPSPDGTVLYAMYASVGKVAMLDISAVWNQAIIGMTPQPGRSEARFLAYWLEALQPVVLALTRSNTQDNLSGQLVANFPFPAVPVRLQQSIGDFLDGETGRVDGLIEAKGRLLAALRERWRNEVVEVVTCGLSGDNLLPIHSSWFPRMPATWQLEPLKRRWTVIDCKHRTPMYVDVGYPLVSHGEIEDGRVHPGRSGHFVGEADYVDLIEGRSPKRGDIVYTRNASIGNAGYVDTDEQFAMGQDVCLITSKDQDQRFLTYFLNFVAIDQLVAQRLGATFGRINVAQIVELKILCPSPEDQRAIADHLDKRRTTYETLVVPLRRQMDLLAERRQALITAAVTGQLAIPA